jgi:hypothetical protein
MHVEAYLRNTTSPLHRGMLKIYYRHLLWGLCDYRVRATGEEPPVEDGPHQPARQRRERDARMIQHP